MKKIRKLLLLLILCLILVFSVATLVACQEDEDPNEFVTGQGNTVKVTLDSVKAGVIDYRLKPGSPIPEPGVTKDTTAPTAEGFVFDGYYEGAVATDGSIIYGNKWDFSRKVDKDITLYGKWLIQYKIRIVYVLDGVVQETGEDVNISGNAEQMTSIKTPSWADNTYVQTYSDPECKNELVVSKDNPFVHGCTQEEPVCKVYAKFIKGTWTLVRTANDLRGFRSGDSLYLMDDIDMSSLVKTDGYTNMTVPDYFNGKIEGNGHTISNINYLREGTTGTVKDTNNCLGLFAKLNGATVQNVTFKNCSVQGVVKQVVGSNPGDDKGEYFYGFLAGQAEGCQFANIKFVDCELKPLQFDIKGKNLTAEQEAAERAKIQQNFLVGEGSNYEPEIVVTQATLASAINLLANEYALQPNSTNKFC